MDTKRTIPEFLTSLPGRSYKISNKYIEYFKSKNREPLNFTQV